MNVQSLIPFAPFLAILYLLYALIQSLRQKRQGLIAIILALLALAAPIAAIFLAPTPVVRAEVAQYLTINGIIVFVGSFIIWLIERRNPSRSTNRSYSILGFALAAFIAVEIFVYPFIAMSLRGNNPTAAQGDNSTLENIAQTTSSGQPTAFAQAATAQTGLSEADLTTQLQGGSTLADLVSKHNGDLDAVTKAATTALDEMTQQGGFAAQMMSRLGSDSATVASDLVQGKLQARAQQLLMNVLLTGAAPSFSGRQNGTGGNFAGGNGGGNFNGQRPNAEATADASGAAGANGGAVGGNGNGGNGNGNFSGRRQNAGAESTADASGAVGGNGNGGNQAALQPSAESTADASSATGGNNTGSGRPGRPNGTGNGGNGGGNFPPNGTPAPDQSGNQVAQQPTAQPTSIPATPTSPVVRPTVIVFPTLEPVDESTAAAPESTAESTAEAGTSTTPAPAAAASGATCVITPIYNLNLRDKPSATDSTVYLSIPFSTQVTADGRTADDWYSVTYQDKKGWVSGEYVATDGQCDKLPVIKPS